MKKKVVRKFITSNELSSKNVLCLTGFSANNLEKTCETCERLQQHSEICITRKAQKVTYPTTENDFLKFTNIQRSLPDELQRKGGKGRGSERGSRNISKAFRHSLMEGTYHVTI